MAALDPAEPARLAPRDAAHGAPQPQPCSHRTPSRRPPRCSTTATGCSDRSTPCARASSTPPASGCTATCTSARRCGRATTSCSSTSRASRDGSIGERSIKRSPFTDVAGIIRSLDYAGRVALATSAERGRTGAANATHLEQWRRHWTARMQALYWTTYVQTLRPASTAGRPGRSADPDRPRRRPAAARRPRAAEGAVRGALRAGQPPAVGGLAARRDRPHARRPELIRVFAASECHRAACGGPTVRRHAGRRRDPVRGVGADGAGRSRSSWRRAARWSVASGTTRPGRGSASSTASATATATGSASTTGEPLADPASGWQPDGVHGPSAVVDAGTVHVDRRRAGAASPSPTPCCTSSTSARSRRRARSTRRSASSTACAASASRTVELMPVNAFPGRRNWGYDGVFPSAVQQSYGGPEASRPLRRRRPRRRPGRRARRRLQPPRAGGQRPFARIAPYFTDAVPHAVGRRPSTSPRPAATTSGGRSSRAPAAGSRTSTSTGCRLDAVDTIHDPTALPFLEELAAAVHRSRRQRRPHRARDRRERRQRPGARAPAATRRDRVRRRVGRRRPPRAARRPHRRPHGVLRRLRRRRRPRRRRSPTAGCSGGRRSHVPRPAPRPRRRRRRRRSASSCSRRNHDHVGNTPAGARPPYDHRRRLVAAATVLLSPFTPMLFMGEEYGEPAPFPFFVDHGDPACWRRSATGAGASSPRRVDRGGRRSGRSGDVRRRRARPVARPVGRRTAQVLAAYTELLALRRRHGVVHDATPSRTSTRHGDAIIVDPARRRPAVDAGGRPRRRDRRRARRRVGTGRGVRLERPSVGRSAVARVRLAAGRLAVDGLTAPCCSTAP